MRRAIKEETGGRFQTVLSFLLLAIFLFLFISIQTALSFDAAVFGAAPLFAFVFLVCYSVKQGGTEAIFLSFLSGLLLDALSGTAFPYSALLYGYISMGCVYVRNRLFYCSLVQTLLIVCFASLVLSVAHVFVEMVFVRIGTSILDTIKRSLVQAIYHVFVALILYPLVTCCTFSRRKERGNEGGKNV